MRIVIAAIGSQGDVNPFLKIGVALHERGHEVILLSNNYFRESIQKAGLEFISVGSEEAYKKMVDEIDLDNPSKIMMPVLNHLYFPSVQKVYDTIKDLYTPGETIVLGITMAFGARIAQEKLGVPLITCHLSPVSFRSSIRPARHAGLWMPDWMPKFYKDSVWRLIDLVADKIMAPPINQLLDALGLLPVKRIMKDWIHSPDKVIGLFPNWFADSQADWPANTALTSFVFWDDIDRNPLQPELEEFMRAGEPPIIFTAGTAVKNAAAFFEESVKACEILNRRAVLLSQYENQIPDALPGNIIYCKYAPFSTLLPKSAALVHHGGIGTCAQALRAGIPQLLAPFGMDQHDNSSRLMALGVGDEVCMQKFECSVAADKLRKLLGDKDMHLRCKKIAAKLEKTDALTDICRIIESCYLNPA